LSFGRPKGVQGGLGDRLWAVAVTFSRDANGVSEALSASGQGKG
jgi:hypothetical protein